MTIPFWCLLIVILLPYAATVLSVRHRKEQFGGFDNRFSRLQGQRLEGKGALVWAAHQPALEARATFIAAVVVAHLAGADAQISAGLAVVFVVLRALHMIVHVGDMATARSIVFGLSMLCCLLLFVSAALA